MKTIVTASAKKSADKKHGKKGRLRHIHIETAENGVSITAHHDSPDEKRDSLIYESPKPTLATSHDEAMSHIGGMLADHFGVAKKAKDGTKAHEKAESKAEEAAEQEAGDDDEED